jgi:hypothetical protein
MAEDSLSRLFQLPAGDFTAARNALAKELREKGKVEEADRVAALRKPSAALWLVNQISQKAPAALAALIAATDKMREIQRHGRSGDDLREAMRQQREALHELLASAPMSQAVQRRVQSTLQAAATSEPDALREGRLEHELEPAGFEAVLAGGVAAPPKPDKRAAEEKKKLEQELRAAEKKAQELADRAEEAERATAKAEASAAKAREHARAARAAADAAGVTALELRRKGN